ncbi:MAG: ABC transporter ATP-binding protein [Clostridiales bacterium]|nr:ABC transporter ATP-binding protein [Clostridiales bacterium]
MFVKAVGRLLIYLKPYRKHGIAGPVFKLIEAILELYLPLLMARVIDRGVAAGDSAYVLRMGGVMLLIVTVGLLCALVCQYVASVASQGVGTGIRNALFEHIGRLSHSELDRFGTPSLINRVTNDVTQLQYAVAMLIRLVVRAPFLCIGGVVMAMTIDLPLSLVIVVAIPLFLLVITAVMRKTVPLQRAVQQRLDRLTLVLRENLSGIRVIRAFSRTGREEARFDGAVEDHTRAAIQVGRLSALLAPSTQLIMNLGILAIVWFGGVRVEAGGMTTGEIIAFINYVNQILLALMVVANLVVTFTRAYASAGRVAEVLDTVPSIGALAAEEGGEPVPGAPAVEFRGVSFSYNEGEEELSALSFAVPAGATVGIIGGTGSGKSTLINLIARFYDVTGGELLVEGLDVRRWPLEQLRARIGIVPQKTELFSGTIGENIRWGAPDAEEEAVKEAARMAQAAEFIERMPQGYNSEVERGGANLSGGQRQRLSIARALVRRPSILILDDASSALDYATDAALRRALHEGSGGMTVMMVSQRVSAVRSADLILVLDDGRLAGVGTHEELLASCEAYQEICRAQESDTTGGGAA